MPVWAHGAGCCGADQRRLLEDEARRQGRSVAAVIGAAVDERYGAVSRERRLAAAERIAGMAGEPITLRQMEAVLDARHDDAAPLPRPPPG